MKKTTTKKSPTGAPLGNPLKFFREGGEQIKAMFKKGGYKVPVQKLIKAQYGRIYQGPLTETNTKKLDTGFPSTAPVTIPSAPNEANLIRGFNRFENGEEISNEQREREDRAVVENRMRNPSFKGYKKGGTHKMPNGKVMLNSAMKKKTSKKK